MFVSIILVDEGQKVLEISKVKEKGFLGDLPDEPDYANIVQAIDVLYGRARMRQQACQNILDEEAIFAPHFMKVERILGDGVGTADAYLILCPTGAGETILRLAEELGRDNPMLYMVIRELVVGLAGNRLVYEVKDIEKEIFQDF